MTLLISRGGCLNISGGQPECRCDLIIARSMPSLSFTIPSYVTEKCILDRGVNSVNCKKICCNSLNDVWTIFEKNQKIAGGECKIQPSASYMQNLASLGNS